MRRVVRERPPGTRDLQRLQPLHGPYPRSLALFARCPDPMNRPILDRGKAFLDHLFRFNRKKTRCRAAYPDAGRPMYASWLRPRAGRPRHAAAVRTTSPPRGFSNRPWTQHSRQVCRGPRHKRPNRAELPSPPTGAHERDKGSGKGGLAHDIEPRAFQDAARCKISELC